MGILRILLPEAGQRQWPCLSSLSAEAGLRNAPVKWDLVSHQRHSTMHAANHMWQPCYHPIATPLEAWGASWGSFAAPAHLHASWRYCFHPSRGQLLPVVTCISPRSSGAAWEVMLLLLVLARAASCTALASAPATRLAPAERARACTASFASSAILLICTALATLSCLVMSALVAGACCAVPHSSTSGPGALAGLAEASAAPDGL